MAVARQRAPYYEPAPQPRRKRQRRPSLMRLAFRCAEGVTPVVACLRWPAVLMVLSLPLWVFVYINSVVAAAGDREASVRRELRQVENRIGLQRGEIDQKRRQDALAAVAAGKGMAVQAASLDYQVGSGKSVVVD